MDNKEEEIRIVAELAATDAMFTLILESLRAVLASTGRSRERLAALRLALQHNRGSLLTVGALTGLTRDDERLANAAFRVVIERLSQRVEKVLAETHQVP